MGHAQMMQQKQQKLKKTSYCIAWGSQHQYHGLSSLTNCIYTQTKHMLALNLYGKCNFG